MISNCGHDENGAYAGGKAGDQSGTEWYLREWYSKPWDCVIRYPSQRVRDTIAELATEAAKNDLIGYDQNERLTFWEHLKASNYYPKDITEKCEADCSSGVAAIVKATGYILGIPALQNVSIDCYTGNLKDALWSAGFEVLTDSMYTSSEEHLQNGDILLSIGHHTCIEIKEEKVKMAVTAWDLRVQCNKICTEARTGGWKYGDSKTLPPCADKIISCDRLIALALYRLGYTDQPKGGITVLNMESYLTKWGFSKITDSSKLTHGDIVLMKANGTSSPTAAWHAFLCDQFWGVNKIYKYDCGSQMRIQTSQPFANVPLNEWSNRTFYCGFRVPGEGTAKITKPTGTDAKVSSGVYTIHSALNDKYVIDITGGSVDNGANVQLYKENGSLAQEFYIVSSGLDETYLIGNVNSGKMLDVTNGGTNNGANIQQYASNKSKAQRFWIQDAGDGYVTIYPQISAKAIDVTNGKVGNGSNIQQYTPNGSNAQRWKLKKV